MFKEILQTRKRGFLYIMISLTASFCLLSFPAWINWTQLAWIYEVIILAATIFLIYFLVRHRFYEYTYIINGDKIFVRLRIGKKQKTVCEANMSEIKAIIIGLTKKELVEKFEVENFYRCNGDFFGFDGTSVVFQKAEEKPSVMVIKPSEKFTEILQTKHIDK